MGLPPTSGEWGLGINKDAFNSAHAGGLCLDSPTLPE